MRSRIIFVVVVTVLATLFMVWRRSGQKADERAEIASRAAEKMESAARHAEAPAASRVRKLSAPDRAMLAEQIRASIAKRVAADAPATGSGSSAPPELDVPLLVLEDVGPELKSALDESIPIIGECYEKFPGSTKAGSGSDKARVAVAMMVMTSDPELGTVVDADKLTDEDGTPLDDALETCLRDTIQSLALPPLGKPGKLPLQYSFRSD